MTMGMSVGASRWGADSAMGAFQEPCPGRPHYHASVSLDRLPFRDWDPMPNCRPESIPNSEKLRSTILGIGQTAILSRDEENDYLARGCGPRRHRSNPVSIRGCERF